MESPTESTGDSPSEVQSDPQGTGTSDIIHPGLVHFKLGVCSSNGGCIDRLQEKNQTVSSGKV